MNDQGLSTFIQHNQKIHVHSLLKFKAGKGAQSESKPEIKRNNSNNKNNTIIGKDTMQALRCVSWQECMNC